METLWCNTCMLCNITCQNCLVANSPRNDRLINPSPADLTTCLDEVLAERVAVRMIGFPGGEPFMAVT